MPGGGGPRLSRRGGPEGRKVGVSRVGGLGLGIILDPCKYSHY